MSSVYPLSGSRAKITDLESAYWLLRAGAALCFIGHGAFGFITKAAWLPYFGVVGIPETYAWKLMPAIGAVDVLAAMAVLFAPRGLPLAYMAFWAAWTALLRPLAGESMWEAVERAGNYGVPLALLMLTGLPRSVADVMRLRLSDAASDEKLERVILVLRLTTAALLVGHGALVAIVGKPIFATHYASIGLPEPIAPMIGTAELVAGILVLVHPARSLLISIALWKLATESLWLASGSPIWEVVERAGSYAAPLALALLLAHHARRASTSRAAA